MHFLKIKEGKLNQKNAYHDNNLKRKVRKHDGKKWGRHADNSGNWK
jgi:hypothetical protein